MSKPTFSDYLRLLRELFDKYQEAQTTPPRRGAPYTYKDVSLILFFAVMTLKQKYGAKAQRSWLKAHPEALQEFSMEKIPSRWTLRRRWKKLYETIQGFVDFVGEWAKEIDEAFDGSDQFIDKSLFKASGPVWHKKDREAGRIPEGLRNLDTDASWSKSDYQGWVYGFGGHWTTTKKAFPLSVDVETACVSEAKVIDRNAEAIWEKSPHSLTGDNSYCNLKRVHRWAKRGVALITSALKVKSESPHGGGYKDYITQPENKALLKARGTATEPLFDLIAQLIGAGETQKQLPVKGLANVRTCLAFGTLLAQLAMIVNSIWGVPLHSISHMVAVLT
jgi:hypothetical protein